jgi:hypothetical protein
MKNLNLLTIATALMFMISSCKNNAHLDEETAADVIGAYLQSKPEYESTRINVGEIKFKSNADKVDLGKYKLLEDKGLVEMDLQNQKKKFLSKDSSYFYNIRLTDKAKPYVLKLDDRHATVRAVDYLLDDAKPISLIQGDSRVAKVTVSLKKEKNDFAVFLKSKGTASNFITKTYKLKFKKETGWILVGE